MKTMIPRMKTAQFVLLTFFIAILFVLMSLQCTAASQDDENPKLQIVYFYSSKCLACKENEEYIDKLEKINGVSVLKYNTETDDCSETQYAYATHFGVPEEDALKVPYIYFGSYSAQLSPETHNATTKQIESYLLGREEFTNFEYDASKCKTSPFQNFMDKISIAGVLTAGLIDGVNPCAISMLMVFFSFVQYTGNRKQILAASSAFIIGIFLTNFLFGLGVKTFYDMFAGNSIVIVGLYAISIILCTTIMIVNLVDIIKSRRHNGEQTNQLPTSVKYKISDILRRTACSKAMVPAALISGIVIGAIELACTGQIYLPTLTYMITSHNDVLKSVLLLLLYNIMFVLPLTVVAVIAFVCKKPEDVKTAIMKRNYIIKIIGVVFFGIMVAILIRELIKFF